MTCFIVFYTKMPTELTSFVVNDGFVSLSKDGLSQFGSINALRATLRIRKTVPEKDVETERTVNNLLRSLQNSGLILSFHKG